MVTTSTPPILVWRNLFLASSTIRARLNDRLSAEGRCSLLEHDLVAWLAVAAQQRLRMLDLARRLEISPGGLTRVADRLVERGWIERQTPANNRREVYAVLTSEGARALKRARVIYLRVLRETLARYLDTSELETLAALTGSLHESLIAEDRDRMTAASQRPRASASTRS